MPYSLNKIYNDFTASTIELNRIVTRLSSMPQSLERDTHIEGCFIRLVVSWEVFIEEYYLRCCCSAKTRTSKSITPLRSQYRNLDIAFKQTHKDRKSRNSDYLDWLTSSIVKRRLKDNFRKNSRVMKIIESPDKLFALRIIRNAIAHRSKSSIVKFEKYVTEQFGYLVGVNPTMADLLIQRQRQSGKMIFVYLAEYFLSLVDRLTK